MKILFRLIIMLGFAVPGLLLGALYAGKSGATEGAGLAGGAIVLGYGLIGAVAAALIGLLISLRLPDAMLPRTAALMGVLFVGFAIYATVRIRSAQNARLDPPEAYDGIPRFTLTLERTENADPVLAKRLTVDSQERRWTSVLPDGRVCSAQASAAPLLKAAGALEAFLEATGGDVACPNEPEEILGWDLQSDTGRSSGSVELTSACLQSSPEAQVLVFALQQVSMRSDAPTRCR